MLFRDLWCGIVGERPAPAELADHPISRVVVDSRQVLPGALFVALPGERTDGHLYLADALRAGAVAAIAEPKALELGLAASFVNNRGEVLLPAAEPEAAAVQVSAGAPPAGAYVFVVSDSLAALQDLAGFWRSRMPVTVVGITGSVGKTTTKETAAGVLAMHYATLRNEGNLNNEIGLPLTLLRLTAAHERAVLEMGTYGLGEIARLCLLARPTVGIVTNIGPTHLERLGTIEHIAQAKSELVQALPDAGEGGIAILNADDPRVLAMREQTRARVFTYGLDPSADLWADEIFSEGLEGIGFCMHFGRQTWRVRLDMLGRHSVHTALRAAAVGLTDDGMNMGEIIAGLRSERGNLRLMVVPGLRDTTLIDDTYNASPVSMLAALNLLDDVANDDHRAVAVLGDMLELGPYEIQGHWVVGGRAAQVADKLVTVGRRARLIAEEALSSGMRPADVYPTDSNEEAVAILQGLMRAGDVVLVKGSRAQMMETIVDALSRPGEVIN
jgi:UDP-N-acetylmuramoyl-tripeptide--D-alanyl-D-alanine ligase